MKKFLFLLFLTVRLLAATGDISVRSIGAEGYYAILTVDGFTSGAKYASDLRGSIPGTFTSGTFTDGETVTQTGGAAKAVIVGAQSSGTSLSIKSLQGGMVSISGNWTGGSSGAVFAGTGSPAMIPGANTPFFTVTSQGYDATGTLGTVLRTVYITSVVRIPWATSTVNGTFTSGTFTDGETATQGTTGATAVIVGSQSAGTKLRMKTFIGNEDNTHVWTGGTSGATFTASAVRSVLTTGIPDELVTGSAMIFRAALSMPIYANDTATLTVPAGYITNTGGSSQTSNALSAASVTISSTLVYPKVVMRFVQPEFERWTGDTLVEVEAFHPFGMACVKIDCADASGHNATQQIVTQMMPTTVQGDARVIGVFAATVPVSALTQGDVLTGRARAYPVVGNAASVCDSDTSADGVAAPSADLTPLMAYCDKSNVKACYASVNGVGGSPAVAATAASARTTPYDTIANALTALKSYNNSNNSDNSLNNCIILMQNGSYTGPGTFTGSNTKSFCTIQGDLANGATIAGVIISTATNAAFNGYLKVKNVTITASGSGVFRGNASTGAFCLEGCVINSTSTSFDYAWVCLWGMRNTIVTFTQGFNAFGANKGPWKFIRGNSAPPALLVSGMTYCVTGNAGISGGTFQQTGNANGNPVSDNFICSWNEYLAYTNLFSIAWAPEGTNITKGGAMVGNLVERITSTTTALNTINGDNCAINNVSNIYLIHNSFMGARNNENYQEYGNVVGTRSNWFELYNLYYDFNTKTDGFQNANRTVADGVFTSGNTTITSATAAFVAGDVGQNLSADGIPGGLTTIASRTNGTTVVLTVAPTVTQTAATIWIRNYGKAGNRVGNWAWVNGCGVYGNRYEITNFPREFAGLNTGTLGTSTANLAGYVGNRSAGFSTSATGNGDYRLMTNSTARNIVPIGGQLISNDLRGVRYTNNGTGSSGALQFNSANLVATTTTTINPATTTTLQP